MESTFRLKDSYRFVLFEFNEIKNITSDNFTFDLQLEGKLNREIQLDNINNCINIKLDLIITTFAPEGNCVFEIKEDKKANFICRIDINDYKDIHLFSFSNYIINTENYDIYLSRLDEIYLINDNYEEKIEEEEENNKKKDNRIGILVGCFVGGVILIGGVIVLTIYLLKVKCIKNVPKKGNKYKISEKVIPMEINSKSQI